MSNNKTGNFLSAIEKYSAQERQAVLQDIQVRKAEAVRKAELRGQADSENYIRKFLAASTAEITGEYAIKNIESQSKLFKKRDEMVQQIFGRAFDRLMEFSGSDKYKDALLSYAKEITDKFQNNKCVVYLRREDMKYAEDIKSVFNSEIEIKEDITIRLGGLRAYSKELELVADNTLDSKLEEQKKWFVENADLKL